MKKITVGLVQIQSHPAISTGYLDFMSEPFVPSANKESLSFLNSKGANLGVQSNRIRDSYLDFQEKRILAIVDYYRKNFANLDLLVFPEGSIPINGLPALKKYSEDCGVTILAGSHSFSDKRESASKYKSIGADPSKIKLLIKADNNNILTLIRNGKLRFLPKTFPSIFEKNDKSSMEPGSQVIKSEPCTSPENEFSILPLNCSEALHEPKHENDFNLAAIISYHKTPEDFNYIIGLFQQNHHHVVYCNDGLFGGTKVCVQWDSRKQNFFFDTFKNGLPPGEANLVFEMDLETTAVQVGTFSPTPNFRLISLAPIVYELDTGFKAYSDLLGVRKLTTSAGRSNAIRTYIKEFDFSPLSRVIYSFLAEKETEGLPCEEWWDTFSKITFIPNSSFEALTGSFCAIITEEKEYPEHLADECLPHYHKFLKKCKALALKSKDMPEIPIDTPINPFDIVDREREQAKLNDFFNSSQHFLLQVCGLEQVGKSFAIEKATTLIPKKNWLNIHLLDSASPDFILSSILGKYGYSIPTDIEIQDVFKMPEFKASLASVKVIYFTKCHNIVDRSGWKTDDFNKIFDQLLFSARELGIKIICESRRRLPLEVGLPDAIDTLTIRGFTGENEYHGKLVLDLGLRKIGYDPNSLTDGEKSEVIQKVGGHLRVLSICPSIIKQSGPRDFVNKIRKSPSSAVPLIRSMINNLKLTETEIKVLQLLCYPRILVPKELLSRAIGQSIEKEINDLVSMSAVEQASNGSVKCSDIIRSTFDTLELDSKLSKEFNLLCADHFRLAYEEDEKDIIYLQESDYHFTLAGETLRSRSHTLDGQISAAREFVQKDKFERAIVILEKVGRDSSNIEVPKLLAICYSKTGRSHKALESASRAFNQNPRTTGLLNDIIRIAFKTNNPQLAEDVIELAKSAKLEEIGLLIAEGQVAFKRHRYDDAEAIFKKALQKDSKNAWPFFWLGLVYQKFGELEDARSALEDGLRFIDELDYTPQGVQDAIISQLAYVYAQLGDEQQADAFLQSIKSDGELRGSTLKTFFAVVLKRDGFDAAKAFLDDNKARINWRDLHVLYGLYYFEIPDYNNGYQKFKQAHLLDPYDVFVMVKYAKCALEMARIQKTNGHESAKEFGMDCLSIINRIQQIAPRNKDIVYIGMDLKDLFPEFFE